MNPSLRPNVPMPHCDQRQLLRGQKALVTGANSGIGKATALGLARAGAEVMVNYVVDEDAAREVTAAIRQAGGRGIAHQADVSDEGQVAAMFRRAVEEFGALDILVNNAGIQRDADLDAMSLDEWRQVIDVNLTGAFLCAREAVRCFKRQGLREDVSCAAGKIVFVSSVHEVIPWAGHANYAASKGGVMLLMQSLAQEVAPHRIRVNSVGPGAIRTPINRAAWETPEALEALLALIPYERIGEPDDISRAIVWLASDEADYVTGTTLMIDGGMTLYPGFAEGG